MPDEIDDLEAPDTWDWSAETRSPGVPNTRVTVSVTFTASDFGAVAACAESEGLTVTEFVRRVVLETVKGRSGAR